MENISLEAKYTLQFVNQTKQNIFLTGKAGTGKTTLLHEIIKTTHKNVVVVAPTGIAALNAGGVTIHSMFQLPLSGFIPDYSKPQFSDFVKFETKSTLNRHFKMGAVKKSVIRNMELLIIDEVSMLRADLLDAINFMLQSIRKNNTPFGGVQILFMGDLLQLPPVIREEEWNVLRNYYKGKFFFYAHALEQDKPLYIELSKIFRQTDPLFISVLNNLRNNKITPEDIQTLNQYIQPNFDLKANTGYITLTTHNTKADNINAKALQELDGTVMTYKAEIIGDFPEKIYPVDELLKLKVGAQIMFIKNDLSPDKKFFNGKMGFIKSFSSEEILVHFPEEKITIPVEKYEWENIRYNVNPDTKEIEEEILGTFVHYPIKLAWAITIHKSQGLTFDKAVLDVSQVFMPGQAYVALSRLRSLKGLVLLSPLQMNGISNDANVMDYSNNKASEQILQQSLKSQTHKFILQFLKETFNWNELAQEWRNHQYNYKDNNEKEDHYNWAKKQTEVITTIQEPAIKFINQLEKLFSEQSIDVPFINQRVQAAYNYFYETLNQMLDDILWKLEEVRRTKKAKALFDDLNVIEELQTVSILKLKKAKLLTDAITTGKEIVKENLISEEIKNYKKDKVAKISQEFKEKNQTLINDDVDIERYTKKEKPQKEAKKSTVQETYELWQQKHTIKEISEIRKLTTQTIGGHLAKLIENGTLNITEILTQDKIQELAKVFEGYTEDSLTPLKEKVGDQFSWDELKMYKASL